MKLRRRPLVAAGVVALTLVGVTPVTAQEGIIPRAAGLFGGTAQNPDSRQTLDLSLSVIEAYDSDSPTEVVAIDRFAAISGYSTMLAGNGAYSWRGSRAHVGANGTSVFRYFNEVSDIRSISHSAALGVSASLTPRTSMYANQTAAYSPWYLYGLFPVEEADVPGEQIPVAPDYETRNTESFAYRTTLDLKHSLTPRTSLGARSRFSYTNFTHEDARRGDVKSVSIRGNLSRSLTRNTSVTTGYRYQTGNFGRTVVLEGTPVEDIATSEHAVDIGFDYSRPLSATRRMQLGFTIGSAAIAGPIRTDSGHVAGRVYRIYGDGAISYPFGRSWHIRGTYRRGLEYVPGFLEPVFSDGLSVGAGGLITPRLEFRSGARFARGESGLNQSQQFDTYSADVRLRYALTRVIAVHAEYIHYYYDFRGDTELHPDLSTGLERNGIRAGLTVWIPAFRK